MLNPYPRLDFERIGPCFHCPLLPFALLPALSSLPFMANSLWAGPLSPAMLTDPQWLNGATPCTPIPPSLFSPLYGQSQTTFIFFPHSYSPLTLYPHMRQLTQSMPLTYYPALHPCRWAPEPYCYCLGHMR